MWTKNFSHLNKSDTSIAGGKGASLGELTQAGIPVSPGYVILSSAFEEFLKVSDINIEIDAILKTVDIDAMHTVENASERIQRLILEEKEIPKDIEKEILNSFQALNTEFVAVRSSATAEDSAEAAWAGQLDTFLNTREDMLLQNVRKCWASLFTPRAIFYCLEKGLNQLDISVAVVVQKMVNSEAAGIAFSVHPVTEDRNQIIIEAGFGLGEAVVSGQITPDSYVVTKEPYAILDKNIIEQKRGLFRRQGGGNEWQETENGARQVLSDNQILKLSKIIMQIEDYYGSPQDIEWAKEGDDIYIVQSRPITTLSADTIEAKEATLVDQFLADLGDDELFSYEADFLPLFVTLDWLSYYDHGEVKDIYPFLVYKKNASGFFVNLTKYRNVAKVTLKEYLENSKLIAERDAAYEKIAQSIERLYDNHYSADISERSLLATLKQTVAFMHELDNLTLFVDNLDRKALDEGLAEAHMVVDVDTILDAASITDFAFFDDRNAKEILLALESGREIHTLQHVFTSYAHVPSLKEVEELVTSLSPDELSAQLKRGEAKIADNTKKKIKLVGEFSETERTIYEFVNWATRLRDMRKTLINKIDVLLFNTISHLYELWGLGQDMVPVSFAFEVLKGREFVLDQKPVLQARTKEFLALYLGNGRNEYKESGAYTDEDAKKMAARAILHSASTIEGQIKGDVGSRGYAKGRVRIVLSKSQFNDFQDGEVLVASMTRPEYLPLMKKAVAIITDEGGITSHAAIVARELGVPCIIGTGIATRTLKDGDEVEVDAHTGIVKVL